MRETATAAGPWWRRAHWGALLVVGVVLASSATGLGNGFAYDDVVMIEGNPSVVQLQSVGHYLSTPYWGWGAEGRSIVHGPKECGPSSGPPGPGPPRCSMR